MVPDALSRLDPGCSWKTPGYRPKLLYFLLGEIDEFFGEFLLAILPGHELREVGTDFLVLVQQVLLNLPQLLGLQPIFNKVKHLKVVLHLDDFDVILFFDILPSLFFP